MPPSPSPPSDSASSPSSNRSLKQRIMKGVGANAFGQVVTAFVQLVGVPIFLAGWGVDVYGDWLVLIAVPQYFALSDIGFANVAASEMTVLVAQNNRATARSVFQSTWLFISAVSLAILALLVAVLQGISVESVLRLTQFSEGEVNTILVLMVLYVMTGLQRGLLAAGFRCDGNYALGSFYEHFIRFGEYGSVLVAVLLGASPTIAALLFLLARTVGFGFMWWELHRRSPWIEFGIRDARLTQVRRLAVPATAYMGFPLGQAVSLQGMTILVGRVIGPSAVVTFTTLRTLSRIVWQLLRTIAYAVWPEFSVALGKQDLPLARTLHRRSCNVALWSALLAVGSLAIAGEWIVTAWTQGNVVFDSTLFGLMLLVTLANSLWSTSQMVPLAINQHQKVAAIYTLGSAIAIAVAIVTVQWMGLPGVALALLVIDAMLAVYVINTSLTILEDSWIEYVKSVIVPPNIWRAIASS